ncbi:MAG: TonB-dependent receptor plug domain-containing protein [Bacteroidales bacterium]|nr:TonB-dependent receptor plug domain-containing protein [Bacteroidales bacterium]
MRITYFSSLLFLLFSLNTYAQSFDDYLEKHQPAPIQKLYLHTDRQFYFLGDTLWYAAYLVDGTSNIPAEGNSNLYVELINNMGEVVRHSIFTMLNGFGQGYLPIDRNNFNEGYYILRSYNDYLKNFGEDCFFYKTLKISNSKISSDSADQSVSLSEQSEVSIDFYPEGGFLLSGQVNQVAFKVSGLKVEEKKVSGTIFDENNKEISRFSTLYKDMGKLFFTADPNRGYNVKLDGFPDREWNLPEIHNEGAKIVATLVDSAFVNLSIMHTESYADKNFYVAVLHRGQGLLLINVDSEKLDKMIRLSNDYFGDGINRVILLNQDFEPVSERLIFRDKKENVSLNLTLNKDSFRTREEVAIHIAASDELAYNENAALSIVVVNDNALNAKGITQNIKSYLLIDSELKGQITDPVDYFVNKEKISANLKLDLLMLTQGWSNYIWNDLENKKAEIDSTDFGLTIRGKLIDSKKRNPITNSDVFLRLISKTQSDLLFSSTNNQGEFEFQNLFFTDSATCYIQGNNSKGKLNASAELQPVINSPMLNKLRLNSLNQFEDIPLSLYHLNYKKEQALDDFDPDRNTRVLKDIDVIGKAGKGDDGHYRIYNNPSVSLTITKQDLGYKGVFDYLQGRAPGVQVVGGRVIIHGFSSFGGSGVGNAANEPLYLLDGIAIDKSMVSAIKMSSIDKIEVLKGNEAAMFGTRGSTGVISILSKSGGYVDLNSKEVLEGFSQKIMGYAPYREFYSPRYTSENLRSTTPDYRITLYWNPYVPLVDGKASFAFFTCDDLSEYTIFIEGITLNGRTCLASKQFVVDAFQTKFK